MALSTIKNNLNLPQHNGSTAGLQLGGVLVTATAAQINTACGGSGASIVNNVTASTLALTSANNKQLITLNRAAGQAVTLPAATGSGISFKLYLGTTITSNTTTVTTNSGDYLQGVALISNAGAASGFPANGTSSHIITLNGTTKGGTIGDEIILQDSFTNTRNENIKLNIYFIRFFTITVLIVK